MRSEIGWEDIPEEDGDWIDPLAYAEMLERAADFTMLAWASPEVRLFRDQGRARTP